jgi:hypothetical protein
MTGCFSCPPTVNALAFDSSGNLFVGGDFTQINGISTPFIARWNGTDWSSLGSGMNSVVEALVAHGNELYAGGSFVLAGGIPAQRFAKWNGRTWSQPGAVNGWVYALAASPHSVFVGGAFFSINSTPASCIAEFGIRAAPALECPADVVVEATSPAGAETELLLQIHQPCGRPLTVTWNVDGGAVEQVASLAAPSDVVTVSVPFVHTFTSGNHQVSIVVDDPLTGSSTCVVEVTVTDDTVVPLNGTVFDDGLPVSGTLTTRWAQVSGPALVNFGDNSSAATVAGFDTPGTYVLRLTGDDSQYARFDETTITILPVGQLNLPPSVALGCRPNFAAFKSRAASGHHFR